MKKRLSLGVLATVIIITIAITFSLTVIFSQNIFNATISNLSEREAMYEKISEIDVLARENYYEDIDRQILYDYLAAGYIAGLGDNYSQYITADDYEAYSNNLSGVYVGIGLETIQDVSGYRLVTEVYEGSPADMAGILQGDLVVAVEGFDLLEITTEEFSALLSGEVGEEVKVTVRRDDVDTEKEIVRVKLEVQSVFTKNIEGTLYIRISTFNESTLSQFIAAVEKGISEDATGLIIDLRNNGGGLVSSCAKILDKLLPEGDIVSYVDNEGEEKVLHTSDEDHYNISIVLLVNENSASAAELFAAAIRDYDIGEIVGQTTFGKGILQDTFRLSDGSAIKLTIGKFYTPNGDNFHDIGIIPNYEIEISEELSEQNIFLLEIDEDPQLQKALEIVQVLE